VRSYRAIAAALLLVFSTPAAADRIEDEARAIEAMLVAPCCWSQQVSVHQSEAATEIKRDVRAALRAGRSRREIVDGYVQRYGTRILIEPPARGFGAWLYVLPVVTLLVSAAGLGLVVRRFASRGASAPKPEERAAPADELAQQRLDDELREMD
jgi:cytochrome c-type biogenesis protein CcmH